MSCNFLQIVQEINPSRCASTARARLGVGTSSPSKRLELNYIESANHSSSNGSYEVLIWNKANSSSYPTLSAGIQLRAGHSNAGAGSIHGIRKGPANQGELAFATTNAAGNNVEAMRIDSSGRVGIGTQSPGHKLVVRDAGSASTSNYLNVISGNAANAGIAFGDTDTDLQAGILYLNSDNALRFFKSGFTEAARIDSSGFLLVGTSSSSGGIQRSLATIGACTIHSTGIIEVANNGTLDLPSVGTSIVGHLYVNSVYTLNAAVRTSKVFFLANRFGNGFTATELNSNDGTSGSRSFSITNPSNNIIRFTNTSGAAVKVTMSFVGSLGF